MTIFDLYKAISDSDSTIQENLEKLFSGDQNLEIHVPPRFERIAPELEYQSYILIKDILNSKAEIRDWAWGKILAHIDPASLPDELLEYFLKNGIALVFLGHMDLSDQWLQKIGKYVEEATFTLGRRIYLDETYTMKNFAEFLCSNHNDNLLFKLLHIPVVSQPKRTCLVLMCDKHGSEKTKFLCSGILKKEKLLLSDDPCQLEDAYRGCNDNNILLALAQNIFTPDEILQSLKGIKAATNARNIRIAAQNTILAKKIFTRQSLQ